MKFQLYETSTILWYAPNRYRYSDSLLYDVFHVYIKHQKKLESRIDLDYFFGNKSVSVELESIYNITQTPWASYYA